MPTLNLQQLISGDDIGTLVEKLNQNFAQLATVGGGPQGSRGSQGPPGLPGLRGESGPAGDAGSNGNKVTLVDDDANWPSQYAGDPNPATTTSAAAAIALGYNAGDVWIDNSAGVFYDIHEEPVGSGIYVFQAHPISLAVAAAGEFWITDTLYNNNDDTVDQGLRLSHRYGTLSLTGEASTGAVPPNQFLSSAYNDISTLGINTGSVFGYKRAAFKLSIDNRGMESLVVPLRISDNVDGSGTDLAIFNQTQEFFTPTLFLNSEGGGDNGFGFLHGKLTDGSKESTVLTLRNQINGVGQTDSTLFMLDVPYTISTSQNLTFMKSADLANDPIKSFSFMDVDRNGSKNSSTDLGLWLSFSSYSNPAEVIHPTNDLYNSFGIKLLKTDAGVAGISAYVHDRITASSVDPVNLATDHVIGISPNNVHITSNDGVKTSASNLSRLYKLTVEPETTGNTIKRIAGFRNNRTVGAESSVTLGIGMAKDGPTDTYPAIYGISGGVYPSSALKPIILQPGESLMSGTISGTAGSINSGDHGVFIGDQLYSSRLGVHGNMTIARTVNYTSTPAPIWGATIEGDTCIGHYQIPAAVDMPLTVSAYANTDPKLSIRDQGFQWSFIGDHSSTKESMLTFASDDLAGRIIYNNIVPGSALLARENLVLGIDYPTGGPGPPPSFTSDMFIIQSTGNIGIGRAPAVGLDALGLNYRQVITKSVGIADGIQITDSSIGYALNRGFILGTLDSNAFIKNCEPSNLSLWTDDEERFRMTPGGRSILHPYETGISNPEGTAIMEFKYGDSTEQLKDSISIGTFNNDLINTLGARGNTYVGYNAEYDDTTNDVTYHTRHNDTGNSAAGTITFSDNGGRWHVACYKLWDAAEGNDYNPPI